MCTSVGAGLSHTDDGRCGHTRTATGNQPSVVGGERFDLFNNVLGEGHERPAPSVSVKPDLDLTLQFENVRLDARGCFGLVKNKIRMKIQRSTAKIRSLKGVGFGDAACGALYGVESVPDVAVATVQGRDRGHKSGTTIGELSTEFLQQSEPTVRRHGDLRGRVASSPHCSDASFSGAM